MMFQWSINRSSATSYCNRFYGRGFGAAGAGIGKYFIFANGESHSVCSSDPVVDWGLEDFMDKNKIKDLLPTGYRLCLWKTTETSQSETAASPSIYLLQALPKKISSSSLPIRRLFCRPRPFC